MIFDHLNEGHLPPFICGELINRLRFGAYARPAEEVATTKRSVAKIIIPQTVNGSWRNKQPVRSDNVLRIRQWRKRSEEEIRMSKNRAACSKPIDASSQYADLDFQDENDVENISPTVIANLPHEAKVIIKMLLGKLSEERTDRELLEAELEEMQEQENDDG